VYFCKHDPGYYRQYVYAANFDPTEKQKEKADVVKVVTPPEAYVDVARDFDPATGRFRVADIPGMIRMVAGIPYAVDIDGDERKRLTIACLHTLDTLQEYPEGPRIAELTSQLFSATWGDSGAVIRSLLDLPIIPNDRSGPLQAGRKDGSYSLANTVSGGQGKGTAKPAVQVDDPEVKAQLAIILAILNELYSLIMPACVSKNEWDTTQYISHLLNVLPMGGPCRGPTSVQANISSLINAISLETAIGLLQGSWHPDKHDSITRLTLFILLLKLKKGEVSVVPCITLPSYRQRSRQVPVQ
jgi:hypothetical protein